MVKLYRTVKSGNEWQVFETRTDHVIKQSNDESAIKKLVKHLKGGGGFNGWTPAFFLIEANMEQFKEEAV